MPKSSIRFSRPHLFASLTVSSLILLFASSDLAWAHRRGGGMGFDPVAQPADNAYALVMALIIAGMIASLFGALLYFRWRAAHPLAEPDSIHSAVGDGVLPEDAANDNGSSTDEPWKRSADWWRSEEDHRKS